MAQTLPMNRWDPLHQAACQKGDRFYRDPETGLFVMTEIAHRDRGHCCGSRCRHCPFDWINVPNQEPEARAAVKPKPAL